MQQSKDGVYRAVERGTSTLTCERAEGVARAIRKSCKSARGLLRQAIENLRDALDQRVQETELSLRQARYEVMRAQR